MCSQPGTKTGPATSCNTASRELVGPELAGQFCDLTRRVGELFGVPLPAVEVQGWSTAQLKKFCGGLLEPSGRHPWAHALRTYLPSVDRLSVAGSLFSFRKLLPSADVDVSAYAEHMSTPVPPADERFLRFCRKEIVRMFKPGWDRRWRDFVRQTTPSGSACIGTARGDGGARAQLVGRREWFLQTAFGLNDVTIPSVRKLGKVSDSGKTRIVSSSPWESVLLSPLHRLLYSHLSRFDWLLRGEADPGSFQPFVRKSGEVFVSGDYESATDNLKMDVAISILRGILSTARYIPKTVRREALASLQCLLDDGELHSQKRGQLMGNYLSFPLLCLQNYLAFRYFCGFTVPVRVNGDDIVFRCRPDVYRRWADGVSSTGLTLSVGKTMVHRRFFCINSKYFRARGVKEPVVVPILRASCLYRSCEDPNQIAGWANRIGEGFDAARRDTLQVAVLRRNHKAIRCAQRSVTRGLGVKTSAGVITRAGLREWEGFYLSLPKEVPPPAKSSFGSIPQGWAKIDCPLGGSDDPGFVAACVQSAWKIPAERKTVDDYWSFLRSSSPRYPRRDAGWWRRSARLLGLTCGEARAYLRPVLAIRGRVKRVWRLEGHQP